MGVAGQDLSGLVDGTSSQFVVSGVSFTLPNLSRIDGASFRLLFFISRAPLFLVHAALLPTRAFSKTCANSR